MTIFKFFYLSNKLVNIYYLERRENTDSGSKSGVYYYRNTTTMYLAFIIRNLFSKI